MPWKNKNILCHSLFRDKIIQTYASKIWQEVLIKKNILRKANYIVGYTNFKPQGKKITSTRKQKIQRSGRKLTARCPDYIDAVRDSVGWSPKKSHRTPSQEFGLSRSLWDKINLFLPLSSALTFLKWFKWFLKLRWNMTWCNMHYEKQLYFRDVCIYQPLDHK